MEVKLHVWGNFRYHGNRIYIVMQVKQPSLSHVVVMLHHHASKSSLDCIKQSFPLRIID